MPFRRETWAKYDHADVARAIYLFIVIASAIVMAVLFVLILNDRNSIKRESNIRANQIQQQRYDTTFSNCIDQNRRHRRTIDRLDAIARKFKMTHPTAKVNTKETKLLIDAIVPSRNCKVVARKAVHPLVNPTTGNTAGG